MKGDELFVLEPRFSCREYMFFHVVQTLLSCTLDPIFTTHCQLIHVAQTLLSCTLDPVFTKHRQLIPTY